MIKPPPFHGYTQSLKIAGRNSTIRIFIKGIFFSILSSAEFNSETYMVFMYGADNEP